MPYYSGYITPSLFFHCTACFYKWGKYGDYELTLADAATREFAGSKVSNPADWRRMRPVRPLSAAEALLLGAAGHGSQWTFQWAGGAFPVEFKVRVQ
jgi:hypothetical protein